MKGLALAIAGLIVGTTVAEAQEIYLRGTDTLFRAAYCAGALKNVAETPQREPPLGAAEIYCGASPQFRELTAKDKRAYASKEECQQIYLSEFVQPYLSKWKRYGDYIKISILKMPSGLLSQLSLIMRKGEVD